MARYTPRTTSPAGLYLPYYMQTGTYPGAINGAIIGNTPQGEGIGITGANVLYNCVGYSTGRLCEIFNEINGTISTPSNPFTAFQLQDAQNWLTIAISEGYPIGTTPRAGAVGVYASRSNPSLGHVVNVEMAETQGQITRWMCSESHYYYDGDTNTHGSWDYTYLDRTSLKPAFIANDNDWYLVGFFYPFEGIQPIVPGGGGVSASLTTRRRKIRRRIIIV